MFFKIGLLINFPIFTRIYVFESLFNKVISLKACNFIKKKRTLTQMFSCEYHKVFQNSFSYETPLVAASENG